MQNPNPRCWLITNPQGGDLHVCEADGWRVEEIIGGTRMDEKRDASLFANMIEGEIADCKWCARFPGNVHAINMTHDSWMKLVAALRAKEPGSAGPGFESWLRSACFQKPTPEAYDLAKEAYVHSWAACREAAAKVCDEVGRDWKREGYDPKLYASEYLAEEIRAIQPPKE